MNKKQMEAQEEFNARMQAAHDAAVKDAHPLFLAHAQKWAEYKAHHAFCAAHHYICGPKEHMDYRFAIDRCNELRAESESLYRQYQHQIEINWRENVANMD